MNNQEIIKALQKTLLKQGGFTAKNFNISKFFNDVARIKRSYQKNNKQKLLKSEAYQTANREFNRNRRKLRNLHKITENFKRSGFNIDNRLLKSKLEISKKHLLVKNRSRVSLTKLKQYNKSIKSLIKPPDLNKYKLPSVHYKRGTKKILGNIRDILGNYDQLKITYESKEDVLDALRADNPDLMTRDDITMIFDVSPKVADDTLDELWGMGSEVF